MRTYVLYHANCWDGFCAAWAARGVLDPDGLTFIPVQYGEEPPAVDVGSRVYILDFCYPRQTLLSRFCEVAGTVVVLDHHKSAEADLVGLEHPALVAKFDMTKSGGRLAWEHFRRTPAPWLVDYTEDRDLWRWKLRDSRAVNAWLRSHPLDFELWDRFSRLSPVVFVAEGEAILRREKQIVDDHVRFAREVEIGGHKVPCVNATVLFSEIAGELAKGHPFGACYFDRADGKRQWSLRSTADGIDVSEVARCYGGGGHRGEAGFETYEQHEHGGADIESDDRPD